MTAAPGVNELLADRALKLAREYPVSRSVAVLLLDAWEREEPGEAGVP
jgi:hypothetical protein